MDFKENMTGYKNQEGGFPELNKNGAVNIAQGGTNAKTAPLALVQLGLTARSAEINTACDGILATAEEINTVCDGILSGSEVWDPASIAASGYLALDVTVAGAAVGDQVIVGAGVDVVDLVVSATVTAANTVTIVLFNGTAGAIDLASSTWKCKVFK